MEPSNMTQTCMFCKIVSGELTASIVYKDEVVTAFRDIHPVAPTHVLIVPNKHIQSISHVESDDEQILGRLFIAARKVAEIDGISHDYQKNYPGLKIILSGGDLNYFVNRLKISIFALPNIVIHGLHQILSFNVNKAT